jgi:tRNA/tmRNA/rRNA uracil-C5-methylase (TrmA/RlmC/RlmD family)
VAIGDVAMLTAGTQVELTLEKPVAGGRMLARHDGQVVLVAGAIPGERVRARIERANKGMAFATTLIVLKPSSARRETVGDPLCGGNVYAHVAYAEQAAIKRDVLRDALRHGGRIEWPGDLPVSPSPEHGYRMRARLHVRKGRVGFFREGTHDLCDCAGTGQLLPASIEAVRAFVDATPRPVRDAIDAIELTESIAADERVLHILWSPHTRINTMPLDEIWHLDRIQASDPRSRLTGISCDDPSTGLARTISGQPWVSDPIAALVRRGAPAQGNASGAGGDAGGAGNAGDAGVQSTRALIPRDARVQDDGRGDVDNAGNAGNAGSATGAQTTRARLRRHGSSFFQANRYLVPDLVGAVHRAVSAGLNARDARGPIIDLYAGVGLFAITLAARQRDHDNAGASHDAPIVAVEGDPSSARDLAANAETFLLDSDGSSVVHGIDGSGVEGNAPRLQVEHSSVEHYLERLTATPLPPSSTLIVDPPRTGMSKQALDGVLRAGAARLVYVSCDVATLSRDLRRMIDAGYNLDHLEAFDLFPNTAHVESLAVLSK